MYIYIHIYIYIRRWYYIYTYIYYLKYQSLIHTLLETPKPYIYITWNTKALCMLIEMPTPLTPFLYKSKYQRLVHVTCNADDTHRVCFVRRSSCFRLQFVTSQALHVRPHHAVVQIGVQATTPVPTAAARQCLAVRVEVVREARDVWRCECYVQHFFGRVPDGLQRINQKSNGWCYLTSSWWIWHVFWVGTPGSTTRAAGPNQNTHRIQMLFARNFGQCRYWPYADLRVPRNPASSSKIHLPTSWCINTSKMQHRIN